MGQSASGVADSGSLEFMSVVPEFLAAGAVVADGAETAWVGVGPHRDAAFPDEEALSVYAPDFFGESTRSWRVYERFARIQISELLELLSPESLAAPTWRGPDRDEFEAQVEAIQDEIRLGRLTKAVAFASILGEVTPSFYGSALRQLAGLGGHPLSRIYGFWDAGGGILGATPELLFQQVPGGLKTMALAGTRRPDEPSLMADTKERAEQTIVAEAIRERLTPLGRVRVSPPTEVAVPNLVHLCSEIEVEPFIEVSFEEWVAALHPTPAIGAWPLEAGWEWLRARGRVVDRGRYGAPFGFVAPGAGLGTCYVAIRNVQWRDGHAEIFAGCGVVAASRAEREWNELLAKLSTVRAMLGL